MSRLGANVTGIDASLKNVEVAKYHAKKNKLNIEYLKASPENFKIKKKIRCYFEYGSNRACRRCGFLY